jgi:glucosamine--fructose-6-phosphate aminotransferase (isomerizing)
MCGIVGIASAQGPVSPVLLECLKRLEYRGYDSAGMATVSEGRVFVRKGAGKIEDVDRRLSFSSLPGSVGIAHTRWATHGPPTDENAHPHVDCSGRVAVVHNGIIENYAEIKLWLASRGHVFRSDTDTEVIAHLIEEGLRAGLDPYAAFKQAVSKLRGSYALAVLISDTPDRIYFARMLSPLLVGLGEGANFVASDIPAIIDYTRRVVVLSDGELGYVTPSEVLVERAGSGPVDVRSRVMVVDWEPERARRGGFPHYMLKEIYEQPRAIAETISGFGEDYVRGSEVLAGDGVVYVAAAGTSYHAALYFALLAMRLARVKVIPFISSEYEAYAYAATPGDALLAISQSGETIDTLMAVRKFKERGCRVVSLTNVVGSVISRESDVAVYMKAGPEIGVAATKTFTVQLTALTWIAYKVAEVRGEVKREEAVSALERLRTLPRLVEEVLREYDSWARGLARELSAKQSAYYLGRGLALPIALEGALKLKEIAYIHAEGYPAGESKHGPIALVEPGFPVVFVSVEEGLERKLRGNVEEMRARGAFAVGVVPLGSQLLDTLDRAVELPSRDPLLTPVLSVIPLQLLAYYTAVERGLDPDKPRNLAKTVTVE